MPLPPTNASFFRLINGRRRWATLRCKKLRTCNGQERALSPLLSRVLRKMCSRFVQLSPLLFSCFVHDFGKLSEWVISFSFGFYSILCMTVAVGEVFDGC